MSSRRDLVVLVLLLVSLGVVAALVRPRADAANVQDPRVSTYRATPAGARALLLLVRELGTAAEPELHAWTRSAAGTDPLVVLAPTQRPTPREITALTDWVEGGGTVFVGGGGAARGVLAAFGLRATDPTATRARGSAMASHISLPGSHRWTAGIDSVSGFSRVFHMTSPALQREDTEVLLRTREGTVTAVTFPLGRGRVIAFSDARALRNELLRSNGAALLFARAVAEVTADGAVLRFDEYHQGYREAGLVRSVYRFATTTGPGRALLQAAAGILVLLLLAMHRHGRALPDPEPRRRSPLEHVDALAGAYSRARARDLPRRLLVAGLERRIGRRILERDGSPSRVLQQTAAGRRLQEEWERGDGSLVALSAAVDDFVEEVRT